MSVKEGNFTDFMRVCAILTTKRLRSESTCVGVVSRQCKGATQFGFLPSVRLFEERALELPFQPDAKTEQGSEIVGVRARGLGLAAGPLLSHWDFRAHSGSTTW